MQSSATSDHAPRVEHGVAGFTGTCACGWVSPASELRQFAEFHAMRHEDAML
jgi:hypothetical protein